jgi:hypothetical protein
LVEQEVCCGAGRVSDNTEFEDIAIFRGTCYGVAAPPLPSFFAHGEIGGYELAGFKEQGLAGVYPESTNLRGLVDSMKERALKPIWWHSAVYCQKLYSSYQLYNNQAVAT